jgi:cytochrome P450
MSAVVSPNVVSLQNLPGPTGWPLLGNFPQIDFREFHRQLERWADTYGNVYRFSLGANQFVAVADVDAINYMLRERPHLFGRRIALERIFEELGFNGLFSADDEDWRRQRKIVITALNSAHLNKFYAAMQNITARLQGRWQRAAETGSEVDLCDDLMRYTVDITTQLAFGIDFNTLETDGPIIQQHLDKVFPMLNRRLAAPLPYWRYFKFARDRELDTAVNAVHAQIKDIITECRQRMAADQSLFASPTNFLEAMIAAKEAEGIPFSDDDIVANVFTLLLAGEDTTANTLAWSIKHFIDYPDLFSRVRDEVDDVLAGASFPPTQADAGRLELVEAFANETMRLKPVAPLIISEAKEDTVVAGVQVPAGTGIALLNRYIATRAANFSAPEEFNLDRWLDRQVGPDRSAHNQRAFLPFGGGPRFCPGRNLALLEIKVVLAMFCRHFEVELVDPSMQVDELFSFTMGPTNLQVRFKLRG